MAQHTVFEVKMKGRFAFSGLLGVFLPMSEKHGGAYLSFVEDERQPFLSGFARDREILGIFMRWIARF